MYSFNLRTLALEQLGKVLSIQVRRGNSYPLLLRLFWTRLVGNLALQPGSSGETCFIYSVWGWRGTFWQAPFCFYVMMGILMLQR